MKSRVRRALVVALLVATALSGGAANLPARSEAPQLIPIPNAVSAARLASWASLVAMHEPGRADDAARRALTFTAAELSGILFAVEVGRLPAGRRDVPNVLARGAVVHTDVAAAQLRGAQKADEASHGGMASLHLAMAERLVWQLASRASAHPLIRAWYVTAGSLLLSQLEVTEAPGFLDRGLTLFPDDAQLLLLAGAARELRASARVQDADDLPVATRREMGEARQNLRLAEAFFRRALKVAPTQVESRIRLGRVLGLSGRHEEALAELEGAERNVAAGTANGGVVERPLVYFFALFMGEELDAAGRVDDARRSYRRALELYPGAASAWLEMSRLEWRNGTRDAAASAIGRMAGVESPTRTGEDPWREYFCAGPARDVDRRLQALGGALGGRQ